MSDSSDESSGDEGAYFKPAPSTSSKKTKNVKDESESEDESSEEEQETETKDEEDETYKLNEDVQDKTRATVYVEGISYDADESSLVSHFSTCGIVKEVRLPRYQDSGKPRGYGHVVFETEVAAKKALELDGKYMMKRYLTVRPAEAPRGIEKAIQSRKQSIKPVKGCRTVHVKQLPYDVEEESVKEAFASCGEIVSVRLPMWGHTKKLKGFGYVEFTDEAAAVKATKRSGMKIGDRMVLIDLDTGAPKSSFRQQDGRYWNKGEEGKASLAKRMADKGKKRNQPEQNEGKKKLRL